MLLTTEFQTKTGHEFNDYYKKYKPKLVRFLTGIGKDADESEDVATEAFVTSLNKIESYDPTKAVFSTWLFTIAKRIMIQRSREKSKFTSIDFDFDEGFSIGDTLKYDDTDYETGHAIDYKKSCVIRTLIPLLPEKYATVLSMRHVGIKHFDNEKNQEVNDCLSYQDIAQHLGHFAIQLDVNDVANISALKQRLDCMRNCYKNFYERQDEKFYRVDFAFKFDVKKGGFILFEVADPKTFKEMYEFLIKFLKVEFTHKELNLNTVKSRIRQARLLLYKLTKEDFEKLDCQDQIKLDEVYNHLSPEEIFKDLNEKLAEV